jgi:hypothetical protein
MCFLVKVIKMIFPKYILRILKHYFINCFELIRLRHLNKSLYLTKPLSLRNMKYVAIGKNVSIEKFARIECIDKFPSSGEGGGYHLHCISAIM